MPGGGSALECPSNDRVKGNSASGRLVAGETALHQPPFNVLRVSVGASAAIIDQLPLADVLYRS